MSIKAHDTILNGTPTQGQPPLPVEGVDNVAAVPTAVIVAYDPAWPARAQQLLNEIRSVLDFLPEADHFAYEHIGSTAVPGLAAKPIVDLQVRMPSLPDLADLADILGRTPFVPAHGARPDSPGVHRDIPRPGDATDAALYEKRLFHAPSEAAILHIRRTDSPFAQFVVEFRDWLRHHPDQAGRYEQLKRTLATQHADDPDYDYYTRANPRSSTRSSPGCAPGHRTELGQHHSGVPGPGDAKTTSALINALVARWKWCFTGTASGDDASDAEKFHSAFRGRADTTVLALFNSEPEGAIPVDQLDRVLEHDVVYVGGGSTANLLAVWRLHGIDTVLEKAAARGTVLAGISAGMNCWFEGSSTDSFGPLAPLTDGLGFLPG